jgi:phosphoglycerate dehydrogenase-like enzyme
MASPGERFRIIFSADFFNADGSPRFDDLGTGVFQGHDHIQVGRIKNHRPEIGPDQIGDAQGIVVLTPSVTARTLARSDHLLAIGRFGVGFDAVDVEACTRADVVAFITANAVDRSVAEATVTWMLALTHHVRSKDNLVRTGKWEERSHFMGSELRDRTLGVIGLGGIGRALVELLRTFGMNPPIAYDPFVPGEVAQSLGVRLVKLDDLLKSADFVSIHCPLNDQTRNLLSARELALMKPGSYLLNTARGGIVDEPALVEALKSGRLAGAAIDCFTHEPLTATHPLADLDNVLLAPHCIAWTKELFREIGRAVCQGMLDLSLGQRPKGVLNPQVFEQAGFQRKGQRFRNQIAT